MPAEISHIIFNSLDITSALRLGPYCQRLWAIAKLVIERHFTTYLGPWAGTPIVCIGDGSECGGNVTYP